MDNGTKVILILNLIFLIIIGEIYIAERLIWSEPLNDSLSIITAMFILLAITVSNVTLITFILHKVIYK